LDSITHTVALTPVNRSKYPHQYLDEVM
jgi:hypothetical protein